MANDFTELQDDIREQTGADRVLVLPPFVWVTQGERTVRYWMPETLKGSTDALDEIRLRVVPPNARLKRPGKP